MLATACPREVEVDVVGAGCRQADEAYRAAVAEQIGVQHVLVAEDDVLAGDAFGDLVVARRFVDVEFVDDGFERPEVETATHRREIEKHSLHRSLPSDSMPVRMSAR